MVITPFTKLFKIIYQQMNIIFYANSDLSTTETLLYTITKKTYSEKTEKKVVYLFI